MTGSLGEGISYVFHAALQLVQLFQPFLLVQGSPARNSSAMLHEEAPPDPLLRQAEELVASSIELCSSLKRRLDAKTDVPVGDDTGMPEKVRKTLNEIHHLASHGTDLVRADWQQLGTRLELQGLLSRIAMLAGGAPGPSIAQSSHSAIARPLNVITDSLPQVETVPESPHACTPSGEEDIPPGQPSPVNVMPMVPSQDAQVHFALDDSILVDTALGDTFLGLFPPPPQEGVFPEDVSPTIPFSGRP